MNTMETPEVQGDLTRTWYQEKPKNPYEYRVMLRFSAMLIEFCCDSSNDVDHNKFLSDLRRLSTVDLFLNQASILHLNLFRMTYEALKHHGFIPSPALPTATFQAQASIAPTTSTFPVSTRDLFQNNTLNHYNAAICKLMHACSQLQLTNPTIAGALPVPAVVTLLLHRPSASQDLLLNSTSLLCLNFTLFLRSSHQESQCMFHHSIVRIIPLLLRNS